MHIAVCVCTVNTSSQVKNNEDSNSILVSWFNPTLKALNDAELLKATHLAIFPATINSATTTELIIYAPTELLSLQLWPIKKLSWPLGLFSLITADSVISVTVPPPICTFINCFTPSTNCVTPFCYQLFYFTNLVYFAELHLAIQEQFPPPSSNVLSMPFFHLHKGLYYSIYHQHLTVKALMYQLARPTVITFKYQPANICQVFNAAAAALTFM